MVTVTIIIGLIALTIYYAYKDDQTSHPGLPILDDGSPNMWAFVTLSAFMAVLVVSINICAYVMYSNTKSNEVRKRQNKVGLTEHAMNKGFL